MVKTKTATAVKASDTSVSSKTSNPAVPAEVKLLYGISFIEGGVVMVTEIAGARILTPFFGASLYSWASTLAITLLALMLGYYYGGYLSTRSKFRSGAGIIWLFLVSGILVLLMPVLGLAVMKKTISLSFFSGLIISELFFLFPPICLMGMISPLIISQITRDVRLSGRSAGNIYAISTSGGILFTLLFGFLIIPNYGITIPLRILGLCVALLAGLLLLRRGVKKQPVMLSFSGIFFLSLFSFSQNKSTFFPLREGTSLVKSSEGLLGELEITDEPMRDLEGKRFYARNLTTNSILQEHVFADSLTSSLMYYVNFTDQLLNFIPQKTSALLVGLGTGSLYALCRNHQINTETVELDKRIYDYGVRYFGMQAHSNHAITDGRYYLNTTKQKYDLILLDVIIGENVPMQLISLEAFQRCNQLLNEGGTLIIEHGAVHSFEDNSFVPSVVKTLGAAGFQVSIFNPLRSKAYGDVLLVASKTKFKSDGKDILATKLLKAGPLSDYELPLSCFDTASATVLADDVNNTDILLANHYFRVREQERDELAQRLP